MSGSDNLIKLTQNDMAVIAGLNKASIARKIMASKIDALSESKPNYKLYDATAIRRILSATFKTDKTIVLKKVQAFYNFKGGTGKTSLCYQVASHIALMGFRVLAIDTDPQAHLSALLGIAEDSELPTIYDAIALGEPINNIIVNIFEGLDAIPSNIGLTRLESHLTPLTRREYKFQNLIASIKDRYDFIFIDTNPTVSLVNANVLVAVDHANIVTETQPLSLKGMGVLVEHLEVLFKEMDLPLNYKIIANKYESKTVTAQEVLGALRADYKDDMYQTVVRKNEDINVASKKHLPTCVFASSKSPAFEDIVDLTKEILSISMKTLQTKAA